MSFKLIIEVPDSKLMKTLRLLNGHKVYVETVGEPPPVRPKAKMINPHSRAESLLTMTGKKAQEGTKIETAITLFEKLEKRKGIGTVTVQDFRDTLVKKDLPQALQQRCVTEKFLAYNE